MSGDVFFFFSTVRRSKVSCRKQCICVYSEGLLGSACSVEIFCLVEMFIILICKETHFDF